MADKLTPEQRHRCMASIKGKNTKPEIVVRRFLHSRGFRFRLNVSSLPGKPDIVLRKYRTAIFVNGCFWHGHMVNVTSAETSLSTLEICDEMGKNRLVPCRYFVLPKSNADFWRHKIEVNQARDLKTRIELRNMGWHTVQIWECQLKSAVRDQTLKSLEQTLLSIFLTDQRPKPKTYTLDDEDGGLMVAEDSSF